MPGDNIPESMGEDFSESGGDIISEWMGGFTRNQQHYFLDLDRAAVFRPFWFNSVCYYHVKRFGSVK
jgi:hypothetical protein